MIWLPVVGNYVEIDVYASIMAYADLLNQRSKKAQVYIPFEPNYSVPRGLRLVERENASFDFTADDEAIILDISIPEVINKLVPTEQILELIDHHPGYEEYWRERLGDRAIIEKIGAVATSVFEWWGECWDYEKMSPEIAELLLAAILDNTLDFNASITTERDKEAAKKLAEIARTTLDDFEKWYFSETSKAIIGDLRDSLLKDCKIMEFPPDKSEFAFGQLAIWDAKDVTNRREQIAEIMTSKCSDWMVSVLCISERKNYILASSERIAEYFDRLLELSKDKFWWTTDKLYLRKQIIAKMLGN